MTRHRVSCAVYDPDCGPCDCDQFIVDPKDALITGLRTQIERAFQMLEINDVPRDRARYVSSGIEVLSTRLSRENADLRARLEKAEKDAERYQWLRGRFESFGDGKFIFIAYTD